MSEGGSIYNDQVLPFTAGSYSLQVRVPQWANPGIYSLQFLPLTTQSLSVSLPVTIEDGSPATGAGELEDVASIDVNDFTVPAAGQTVVVHWVGGPGDIWVNWKVVTMDTGVVVGGSNVTEDTSFTLASGHYQVRVAAAGDSGPYRAELGAAA